LDRESDFYRGQASANIVLWRVEELLPGVLHPYASGGPASLQRQTDELLGRLDDLVEAYSQAGSRPLFLPTLMRPIAVSCGVLQSQLSCGVGAAVAKINAHLFGLASRDGRIRILDLQDWFGRQGAGAYDARMDFISRQPFTVGASVSLGLFLGRNLRPLLAPRKKVLAVDLDNTLWGGIVGEDGVEKLKLGLDFPGNVFLRLQRELIELKRQGVLLALLSKNDEPEARRAMESVPGMVLKWDDFVCRKVNFEAKYLNLRQAAAELDLGLDSFVFLDDSDYERAQMRQFNPEVLVLNEDSDPLHMLASLLQTDVFDTYRISEEDLLRHQDYSLRSARRSPGQAGSMKEFLSSLELRASVEPIHKGSIERVVQMLGKTNQFNMTTRRHALEKVRKMLAAPGSVGLTLRLRDKFGDQGIVAALLASPSEDGKTLEVDSLLMSCRVIGRGVEDTLWAAFVNRAAGRGVARITAEFIPTAKNGLAATFYERMGLAKTQDGPAGKSFTLEPVRAVVHPAWMALEEAYL
jgi:FkbH-like protein